MQQQSGNNLDFDEAIQISDKFMHKKGLCGLRNLGNTCFMNSMLQCLSNTRPFLEYVLSNKYKNDLDNSKLESTLVDNWNVVVRSLWYKNAVHAPNKFLSSLQQLAVFKDRGEFTGFQQNDSQEFLQFFLEMFHNAICKEVSMEITGQARNDFDKLAIEAYKNFRNFFKSDYSEIVKIFYGQFFSRVKTVTPSKEEISNTFEPFNMLSLELHKEKNNEYNLMDCLENFTKVEKLDISNKDNQKFKEIKFWSLPEILIIYFKRWNSNSLRKINDLVRFPLDDLDLSKYVLGYDRKTYKYDLYAVSNHGGGTGGGHYWAYARNADNNWYKYNDHTVSTLSVDKVVSPEAYCLFYRRKS